MVEKDLVRQALHLIDNWLDYQVYTKEIPGVSVGIFLEDEVVFRKEYGYANLESNDALNDQHLFRIASHSKLFTATSIMKLYHEDQLSIDDRVSKYLPWFTSESDENMKNIRIRHLLTHSSGMTRDGVTGHWIKLEFPELEDIMAQSQEGISFFETSELLKYSNFGYTILGLVIEAVTGVSYVDYIKENILQPLKMNNTHVDVNDDLLDKHATGYNRKFPKKDREVFDQIPAKVMHAATGFSSTVDDLIKFYKAHILGNNILFPDYIKREMQRTQFRSKLVDWGFGFRISRVHDMEIVGHGGGYPGFITLSGLVQKQKMILVVLTNAIDGPPFTLFMGIESIIRELNKKKSEFLPSDGEEINDFKDIIGFYASHWATILYSQIGTRLVSINPAFDNPTEMFQIYEHKEDKIFISPREPPFGSPGQPIEFIVGEDGEMKLSSSGAQIDRFKYSY
ncbi:MAG: serine hydrolase domain-containing protein [Candidatus Kariarchaeaceae archaeon]|jgi:CubicO group peptidase (beta-lactamase class C family)